MYIRFVVHALDRDSGRRQGLFQALGRLKDRGALSPADEAAYEEVRLWFRAHLAVPGRFSRSRKPHAAAVALSWFRVTAHEHIERMRVMAALLERQGVLVEVIKHARPGYIVYEDEYQVAAIPFNDSAT